MGWKSRRIQGYVEKAAGKAAARILNSRKLLVNNFKLNLKIT
jgi:hypothetical protein